MARPYGTLSMTDLARETVGNVVDFGEDRIWDAINASLVAHNQIMEENLGELVERTTDDIRGASSYARMEMEDLDEFGVPGAQKVAAEGNLGFPLRFKGVAVQWTRLFLRRMTPARLAAQFTAAREADARDVLRSIRRALYVPTNYTFKDRRQPNAPDIPVKALANADGMALPIGPNGEQFNAGTHTHYLAADGLSNAGMDALIETVREHFDTGDIRVVINKAQESAVKGLTGFERYPDPRVQPAMTESYARGALNTASTSNRAIGVYDGAEVWVKPYALPGYVKAYRRQGGLNGAKILAFRHAPDNAGDFEFLFEDERYPLRARAMGREYGVGVQDRIGAAVLYVGGSEYVAPTLN